MKFWALAVAVTALAAAPARAAEEKTFGEWIATCNNLRACVAIGTPSETQEGATGYLRIARGAAAGDAPAAVLMIQPFEDEPHAATVSVQVDGHAVPGLSGLSARVFEEQNERVVLTAAQSAALVAAIRSGRVLTIVEGRQVGTTISLSGSAAALLWIDEQQHRLNTTTALIRTGTRAAGSIPAPPAAPLVTVAPVASQARLPQIDVNALRAQIDECDEDIAQAGFNGLRARLGADAMLVEVPCSRGAYNVSSAVFVTNAQGGAGRRIILPLAPVNDPVNDELPMNLDFDAATQTLTSIPRGRGIGDCGAVSRWVWTGRDFVLISQDVMGACQGVVQSDWPNLYQARRR